MCSLKINISLQILIKFFKFIDIERKKFRTKDELISISENHATLIKCMKNHLKQNAIFNVTCLLFECRNKKIKISSCYAQRTNPRT